MPKSRQAASAPAEDGYRGVCRRAVPDIDIDTGQILEDDLLRATLGLLSYFVRDVRSSDTTSMEVVSIESEIMQQFR